MILVAYTVCDPRTMMIEFQNTPNMNKHVKKVTSYTKDGLSFLIKSIKIKYRLQTRQ